MAQRSSSDPTAQMQWQVKKHNLCVSDMVLLKADAHRNNWPHGLRHCPAYTAGFVKCESTHTMKDDKPHIYLWPITEVVLLLPAGGKSIMSLFFLIVKFNSYWCECFWCCETHAVLMHTMDFIVALVGVFTPFLRVPSSIFVLHRNFGMSLFWCRVSMSASNVTPRFFQQKWVLSRESMQCVLCSAAMWWNVTGTGLVMLRCAKNVSLVTCAILFCIPFGL